MALTVPAQREDQVGGMPNVQTTDNAPAEAFGGGASQKAVTDSTGSLISAATEVYHQQKFYADQAAVLPKATDIEHQATAIELGAKGMLGDNAAGAADYAKNAWDKVTKDIQSQANNQQQTAMLNKMLTMRQEQIDKVVQTHMFEQQKVADNQNTESYLSAVGDNAVANYDKPDVISDAFDKQAAAIEMVGQRQGWSPDVVAQKKADAASATSSAIVKQYLDNEDYKGAQTYYDNNKDAFVGKDIGVVEKSLQDGQTLQAGMDTWDKVQGLKLSDGNPDLQAIENHVMNDSDLADKERQKVLAFVKAKAGEEKVNKAQQDAANDRSFLNDAVQARKDGQPLQQAQQLAQQYAIDPYDQAQKEAAIAKIYAPQEAKTDPATKISLQDGIDSGSVTQAQIDDAYNKQLLSPADWIATRNEYRKSVTDGKDPQMAYAREQVNSLAAKNFSNPQDKADFIANVRNTAIGKSPDEMVKIANDKLKSDPATQKSFFGLFNYGGQSQFQTDQAEANANALTLGKFHQDLGVDTVRSIALGSTQAKPAEAVNNLSVSVGGYDNMKPGTPAYNAIQSLSKHGKIVNADTVKKALENHPDGKF